ncbi:hypothetical protein SAMN04515671_3855 [Nakamurella panacisegetis]|uniref:DUF6895 domain-containing protein n=1 Tax=Nakamurella panacisegetis TaxID=1090615 RepID=A0A1H0S2N7_9ACTN|nr:hypothetical protein [Nakamurella panacisegetis]SDP35526.1 hypothetical protein SAMN04515671_3855 [Nakamurella panacisegetis]
MTSVRDRSRTDSPASRRPAQRSRADLAARVVLAHSFASHALEVSSSGHQIWAVDDGGRVPPPSAASVQADAAMLLRGSAIAAAAHPLIGEASRRLTAQLVDAQDESLLTALCLDPGRALDHAVVHIQLRAAGHADPIRDRLLLDALAEGLDGPERLPHRTLELQWLRDVMRGNQSALDLSREVLARSTFGRPLDVLNAQADDLAAFSHVVLYLSDLGRRHGVLPRSSRDIARDADAGLAVAMDQGRDDLAAELLWTWPMLGIPWSATAVFCFNLLAQKQDRLGFLPGPDYSAAAHQALPSDEQLDYMVSTSYHPTLALGLACAAALADDRAPASAVPGRRASGGVVPELVQLLPPRDAEWEAAFRAIDRPRQEALAPFVLAAGLRRARERTDLVVLRDLLEAALRLDETQTPAVAQAAGLLRRVGLLAGSTEFTRAG